ncbi:MAG: 4-hydroxy-3-methylbut-2-enyl diphosphate reductase, partial [Acidobacteria bacterium]
CAQRLPTFHIEGAACLDGDAIRHQPVGGHGETRTDAWLPAAPVSVGLTAGASTPNNVVGEVVSRILSLRGRTPEELGSLGGSQT